MDQLHHIMRVAGGLHVEGQQIRARLAVGIYIAFGFFDHQVNVEGQGRTALQGFHKIISERNSRHKHAVHHVYMDAIGAQCRSALQFLAVPHTVGGKKRRCNFHQGVPLVNVYSGIDPPPSCIFDRKPANKKSSPKRA